MTRNRVLATAAIATALLVFTAFWFPTGSLTVQPDVSPAVSDLQPASDRTTTNDAQVAATTPIDGGVDVPAGSSSDPEPDADAPTSTVSAVLDGNEVTESGSETPAAVADGDAAAPTGTTASSGASTTVGSATTSSEGVRLRIPSLGVDALVIELGFNDDGQLDVPDNAYTVGWYSISSMPGEMGNALFGGHLNWAGARGVFDRLDELADGDLIYLVLDGQELAYRVSRTRAVTADTPLYQVLQAPAPGSTITLFTCGGTFSRSAGEYDHRFVVNAVRVANGAG